MYNKSLEIYPNFTNADKKVIRNSMDRFFLLEKQTLGNAVKILIEYFSEEQAEAIAITEITRRYAENAQREGKRTKREWGDVMVIKRWFTNNDAWYDDQGIRHGVCDICKSFDGKVVEIDDTWPGGILHPPAHEGCRCWISSSTNISGKIKESEKPKR